MHIRGPSAIQDLGRRADRRDEQRRSARRCSGPESAPPSAAAARMASPASAECPGRPRSQISENRVRLRYLFVMAVELARFR